MKKDAHPKWYSDAKVIVNGEVVMTVGATQPELHVEIWSGTHPFYTGQQRLLDTEGQVERFMRRLQRREEIVTDVEEKRETQSPLARPVAEIPLATRALNALKEAGVNTLGDVVQRLQEQGDDGLLSITGVGQKAVIDIKKYLRHQELI
jgi:large subunit ribosomal protein L31